MASPPIHLPSRPPPTRYTHTPSDSISLLKMPGLARKLCISATTDGLLIQPLASKGQRSSAPIKIRYGEAAVSSPASSLSPTSAEHGNKSVASFEAFGIIGLVTVSKLSFLITITRRETVAHIAGFPVYVVTEVAITPCSHQRDAEDAIDKTNKHLVRGNARLNQSSVDSSDDSDTDSDLDDAARPADSEGQHDDVDDCLPREYDANAVAGSPAKAPSIAENVISKRGSYGRFAQSWFSRAGWMLEHKRSMGLSDDGRNGASNEAVSIAESEDDDAGLVYGDAASVHNHNINISGPTTVPTLLPKLIRQMRVYFGTSRSFYFSYDIDITRSLSTKYSDTANGLTATEPLYRRVDETYFWNRHMAQPFIDGGDESFVLPLMQGFVGQMSFIVDSCPPQKDDDAPQESVEMAVLSTPGSPTSSPHPERETMVTPEATVEVQEAKEEVTDKDDKTKKPQLRLTEKEFLLTLISRRSTKRAGLRYLRRGIDDEGNVANCVETEQMLSSADWSAEEPTYSFLQIRGSIPVFFTQTAYSLKPIPVLQHSPEANYAAFTKHFDRLQRQYGRLQLVNLVEKKGIEKKIGEAYKGFVTQRNEDMADSGDKGELIPFEWFDFHHACRGMKFENVCQLLEKLRGQLEALGSTIVTDGNIVQKQLGVLRTNCMDCLDRTNVCQSSFAKHMLELQLKQLGFDMSAQVDQQTAWFNTLWADNGDAVSNQYASTAAMKGDYTRYRKRDYKGTLNDIGLSLTRFYNGMVNDYFSQAAIDFVLGNVTSMVFDEFEANMMTKDPAVSVSRMRDQAIEQCQKRVIADDQEEFIGGWVLLSPAEPDSLRAEPFQEVVLLLTDAAMYQCRYDWSLDKVASFERVELGHVEGIQAGVYVTSTLTALYMDKERNVGFVVRYTPGKEDVIRMNTRSLATVGTVEEGSESQENAATTTPPLAEQPNVAAGTTTPKPTTSAAPPLSPTSIPLPTSPIASLTAGVPSSLAGLLSGRSRGPRKRLMAFKAPYATSSTQYAGAGAGSGSMSEMQRVEGICGEIERLVMMHTPREAGEGVKGVVEKRDVIGLEEARKSAGLFDALGYAIKKMVWAS